MFRCRRSMGSMASCGWTIVALGTLLYVCSPCVRRRVSFLFGREQGNGDGVRRGGGFLCLLRQMLSSVMGGQGGQQGNSCSPGSQQKRTIPLSTEGKSGGGTMQQQDPI
ncbi:hypothetical protein [Pasteuria penetrans]|uniref:hypothetical protein n=1 Tax=Pasteuria penetrans TaxID=86005 RepID=UPI000FAEEDDA|nr:hypothetical protein [Pasteuria penetrans]